LCRKSGHTKAISLSALDAGLNIIGEATHRGFEILPERRKRLLHQRDIGMFAHSPILDFAKRLEM